MNKLPPGVATPSADYNTASEVAIGNSLELIEIASVPKP